MGEAWALAVRRTNARGTPRLRLSFRTAHTAHACRMVAQATLMGRSEAHMLTPVWALVAKAMENHDRLMQSPWGRGWPWKWGPGEDADLLCIRFSGCLRRHWLCTLWAGGGCPEFPSSPIMEGGEGLEHRGPLEGPDPGTGGPHRLLSPTPPLRTLCLPLCPPPLLFPLSLSYPFYLLQDPVGQLVTRPQFG